MTAVEQIKEEIGKKDKSKLLTFIVFLLISTALWFLIKLTKNYSTQTAFLVEYAEVPVNKWVSTPEQTVKLSFEADGFATLGYYMVRKQRRIVTVPLDEVPYRLEGGNTYSYSSQYIAERVADWLGISASSIVMNDDKQYFNMEDLQARELPVQVPLNIKPQRQFLVYGEPKTSPSSIMVYGPKNMLDTMTAVYTMPFHALNASKTLKMTLPVELYDGAIRSDVTSVEVEVAVEQYTETDVEVPVTVTDTLRVRFFPETMKVKCMVAIKDFATFNTSAFKAVADTAQLHQLLPLLDIHLVQVPEHVKVVKTEPEQVEYLILN